jgi:TatD DNase family protein
MWTDTHCHLDDERYRGEGPRDLGGTLGVLESARQSQVSRFITVGCDAASSQVAIECAREHNDVWASVGLHPHDAVHGVETIVHLITSPRVVAIGEAGLDYYYEHSHRTDQREAFAAQIQLAHQHDLPLIIHTRDAWDDTFDVLLAEGAPKQTIFHCFTGGPDEARRCLDIGAFLSFSGIVTFKTALDVVEAALLCPLERILIETDSPYLAPVPHRGRTNQPANVAVVGTRVADIKNIDPHEMARITTENACIAFPLLTS